MIAKHSVGKGFRGLLSYLLREEMEGREGEAVLLGGNMSGRTARELTHEFEVFRRLNSKVTCPVFHASLRLPSMETLADGQWQAAAAEYLLGMGYTDTPYVVVKHPENHIHIAAGRVRFDGSAVQTWKDRWRGLRAMDAIEQRFGLAHPPRPTPGTRRRQVHLEWGKDRRASRRTPSSKEILTDVAEAERRKMLGSTAISGHSVQSQAAGPEVGEMFLIDQRSRPTVPQPFGVQSIDPVAVFHHGDHASSVQYPVSLGLVRDARTALVQQGRLNRHLDEDAVLRLSALRLARQYPEVGAPALLAALEAAHPGSLTAFPGGEVALGSHLESAKSARAQEYTGGLLEGHEYGTR
jgi:hypothetical protein